MTTLLCANPPKPTRKHDAVMGLAAFNPARAELIQYIRTRWINGSKILWAMKKGSASDRSEVIKAVAEWQLRAPGLILEQVDNWSKADVRIQFVEGGSWSYVGTDCQQIPRHEATMSFGWALNTAWGRNTALHEWGHALGYPHEHQNPNAGIVWNEAAVIKSLSGSPNYWTEEQIRHNILNKIPAAEVTGSNWDPNSVMHYPFEAGLIDKPKRYQSNPLEPDLGLSPADIQQTLLFYPSLDLPEPTDPDPVEPTDPEKPILRELHKAQVHYLDGVKAGDNLHYWFDSNPGECIKVELVGDIDTVLLLKDDQGTTVRADDDSGFVRNASVSKWSRGAQRYYVTVRIVWVNEDDPRRLGIIRQ